MGLGHQLAVTGRSLLHARRRRAAAEPELDAGAFERELRDTLAHAPAGLIRDHAFVHVRGNQPPWQPTELELEAGDRLTTLAVGRVHASKLFDVWVPPSYLLWMRVGERGPIFRGTRSTHSFTAKRAGTLHLASYFPAEWADPDGRIATAAKDYRNVSGGMTVLAIRWNVAPLEGIEALLQTRRHPLLHQERERLRDPVSPPAGWSYLWFLGPAEIYRNSEAGTIGCETHGDVGILQREIALPFRSGTRLRWSWKVDRLPSGLPEDSFLSHDYMSIAVEFENGRDLTYYWSAELPPETGYACPLPTWKDRETHVVVRSGAEHLGEWLTEERDLHADYARHVGDPPERIVKVWLIANSMFQRRPGICAYREIALLQDGESHPID